MSDDLISLQNEPQPAPMYPRGRFIALLVALFLLIVIIGIAQRGPRPVTENSGFSEEVLQGDISVKLAYAYDRWMPQIARMGQKAQMETLRDSQMRAGIKLYREAVQQDRSPAILRRLIIVGDRTDYVTAINSMNTLGAVRKELASEAAMWRNIYLSKAQLSASQADAYARRMRSLHLGWFEHLALADMYQRAGMAREAARERDVASRSASETVARFIGLISVMITLGFLGAGLLTWYVLAKSAGRLPACEPDPGETESTRSFVAGYLLETFVVYLVITIGVQLIAAGVLIADKSIDKPKIAVLLTAGIYVFTGILSFLYLRYRIRSAGWSWRTIGLTSRNPWADIRWGVGGYAASLPLIVVAGLLSRIISRYVETPSNPIIPLFIESSTVFERALLFALAAIAAPFFEEIFFRGVLYHSFYARWGVAAGIIASAAVFGLVHPLPLDFLPILVLGAAFGVLTHQRGSLLPSMIAHGLNNTVAFTMLLILTGSK